MKILFKILKALGITYVILFIVFFFDLDGKFLYYIWEPRIVARYDRMKKKDNTETPYTAKPTI